MNSSQSGTLYIVATPIGNLGDLSPRAIDTLREVSLIACEDTRHSRKLLDHFHIDCPLLPYHEHSDPRSGEKILKKLLGGEDIALISDAGTPLISDPGYKLVKHVRAEGCPVVPIPGACAAIAALSVSGLATNSFRFCGFLPVKKAHRCRTLQSLVSETDTLVFYEAPHRILDSLADMAEVFGPDRHVVMARELTKAYETVLQGTLEVLLQRVGQDSNQQRGEIVLIVEGNQQEQCIDAEKQRQVLTLLMAELPLKRAVALTAEIVGGEKKLLYKLGLELQGK